jgi:hypothetical protein
MDHSGQKVLDYRQDRKTVLRVCYAHECYNVARSPQLIAGLNRLRVLINGFRFADHESSEKHECSLGFNLTNSQGSRVRFSKSVF